MTNGAELAVIDTVWGHQGQSHFIHLASLCFQDCGVDVAFSAGGGSNPKDDEFIKAKILNFFQSTT